MSRLITSGDTLSNFGKYLPVPYIDKIYVQHGTVVTAGSAGLTLAQITTDLFVYLRVNEDTDVSSLEEDLEKLTFYAVFVNNASESTLEKIFDGTQNMDSTDVTADGKLTTWRLSDMTMADALQYDDSGNKIIKYYIELTMESGETAGADDGLGWGESTFDTSYLFVYSYVEQFEEDAWTHVIVDGVATPWSNALTTMDNIERSEMSYEQILKNGTLASQEEVIWVDEEEAFYDGTALQSISSKYYKSDKITHSEIVDSFQSLLDEYESTAKTDTALQSIVDQISYILAIYSKSVDLLPQLNLLRRGFPSKSSATAVGELYLKYRKKIYTANAVIETDSLLSKRLVSNAKIVDQRGSDEDDLAAVASRGTSDGWKMLSTKLWYMYNYVDPDTLSLWKEQMDLWSFSSLDEYLVSDEYATYVAETGGSEYSASTALQNSVLFTKGYFFHDYTAEVLQNCAIGDMIDLPTYLTYFSPQTLYRYYAPSEIRLDRSVYSADEVGDRYTMTQTIDPGWTTTLTDGGANFSFEHGAVPGETAAYFTLDQMQTATGQSETAYAFLALRNFTPYNYKPFTDEYWSGDYRIMGIQFQDIDTFADSSDFDSAVLYANHAQWSTNEYYDLIITYIDNTEQLLVDIISAYASALTGLKAYLTTANDWTAYNIIDGHWNDHFKEEMHNLYDGTPGTAPWDYYPVYFNAFREIIGQAFGGDEDALLADAADIAATISPDTGTMEQLEAFIDRFESFQTEIFNTSSDVFGDAASGTSNTVTKYAQRQFYPDVDYSTDTIVAGYTYEDDREFYEESEQDDLGTWVDYVQLDVSTIAPADTSADMREDPESEFLVNGETDDEAGDLGWVNVGTDAPSLTFAVTKDTAGTMSVSMGDAFATPDWYYLSIYDPEAFDGAYTFPYLSADNLDGGVASEVFPSLLNYFSLVGTPAAGYDVEEHIVPFTVDVSAVYGAGPDADGMYESYDLWFTITPTEELYAGMSSYTLKTDWTNHDSMPTGYSGLLIADNVWPLYDGAYKFMPEFEQTFKTEYGDYSDVLAASIYGGIAELAEMLEPSEDDCYDEFGAPYVYDTYTPCDSVYEIWVPWNSTDDTGCRCDCKDASDPDCPETSAPFWDDSHMS